MSNAPWYWDVERDLLWAGPQLVSIHGLDADPRFAERTADQPLRMSAWLAALADDQQHALPDLAEKIRATGTGGVTEEQVGIGAEARWLAIHALVTEERDGGALKVLGFVDDVSERRALRADLAIGRDIVARLSTSEPLEDTLVALCRQLERRLPGTRMSILVHDRAAARLWHAAAPSLRPEYVARLDGVAVADPSGVSGTAAARGEIVVVEDVYADPRTTAFSKLLLREGTSSIWAHPLIGTDGAVLGTLTAHRSQQGRPSDADLELVGSFCPLAALAIERASLRPELVRAANTDYSTRLPNRACFLEKVNLWLSQVPQTVGVLVLDFEGFHYAGPGMSHYDRDRFMAEVAQRVVRSVGDDGLVAGFDDNELAVATLLSRREVDALAERMLRAFDEAVSVEGAEFYLTPTIGIAYSQDSTDALGLARNATAARLIARTEGLGRVRTYDDEMRRSVVQRMAHESRLRNATRNREFSLLYQPMYCYQTGGYARAEALVRWNHPTRGIVGPDEFIPLAEQTGLILPLGDLVLRMALEQAKAWYDRFPDLRIAVNLSATQMAIPSFADTVAQMTEAAGLPLGAVLFELTESALMDNMELSRVNLERFHELGMWVAVDDFGTGYSSLARLEELPVAALKIDKQFIQRLTADPTAPTVIGAIIDIAHAHGLRTVAEGVEDAETFELVGRLGCTFAQGYHLCHPMSPEATEAFLESPPALG
jgi:predicted signal transduction protein with EAL and GGDEF domain